MTLPLYRRLRENPPTRDANGHAGLWFDKFCDGWRKSNGTWSMSGGNSPKIDWLKTLIGGPVGDKDEIEEFVHRTLRLVESTGGRWMVTTTQSRFVTGLGRSHPVENGFAWHPTLGAPYLPSSSVKGMVRAWAELDADPTPAPKIIENQFGTPGDVGSLCFLDAVPVEPARLEVDVMTPHYAGWSESDPPGDWRSPVPIPFLVTAVGTPFLFGIVPRNAEAGRDMAQVEEWLGEALEQVGAGAKTSVGYGRFALDETRTAKLRNQFDRVVTEREERIAYEQRMVKLSPVQRSIQELIHDRNDQNMPESTLIFSEANKGRWSGDEKIEAARWLKSKMEAERKWKPITKAKKPGKDKNYQRTMNVQRWLDGH